MGRPARIFGGKLPFRAKATRPRLFGGIAFSALAGYGPFMVNRGIDLKEATDGTSNTVAFAELLTVPGRDMRGCLHWGGGAMYLHGEPPNSPTADLARFCGEEEVPRAPCRDSTQGWTGAHKLAARSAHPYYWAGFSLLGDPR